jgi:hypothetical protein
MENEDLTMANIVKIKEIHLYAGFTENAAETYTVKRMLDDRKIPYTFLQYGGNEEEIHAGVYSSLNTWNFGRPEEIYKKTFTDFPIVTWKEYYDDYEVALHVVDSASDLMASPIMTKKELIMGYVAPTPVANTENTANTSAV